MEEPHAQLYECRAAGQRRARRAIATLASALVATSLAAASAFAQNWPERSITLIVPFAPGGASDVSSRIMAEVMSKHLGQSIIIENVAGAGGATGSLRGKNAKPDGYTIGFGHMGTHAAAVATNPKLPYDPRTDFDYLGIHLVTPQPHDRAQGLARPRRCRSSSPTPRAKGKDLKMGHNGAGSLAHLTCVLFFQLAGVEPTYVVYRGFGQTINDILSGSIDGTCDLIASAREQVVGGSVRAFGVAAARALAAAAGRADLQGRRHARVHRRELARALCAQGPAAARSWPSCARPWRQRSKIPSCRRNFPRSAAPCRKKEDRGGDRMLEIIKSDVVRWSEVVKKAGGVEAKP